MSDFVLVSLLGIKSIKSWRPEDVRSVLEHLKQSQAEDVVEMLENMHKATTEDIAAMQARADPQMAYQLNATQMPNEQMMFDPELWKLIATEYRKNMTPQDVIYVVEQLKRIPVDSVIERFKCVAKATPEEIAALHAHADALVSNELNAAQIVMKQGDGLYDRGQYHEALEKYLHAKDGLKRFPLRFECRTLRTHCSLRVMRCYSKTNQYVEHMMEYLEGQIVMHIIKNSSSLDGRYYEDKGLEDLKALVNDHVKMSRNQNFPITVSNIKDFISQMTSTIKNKIPCVMENMSQLFGLDVIKKDPEEAQQEHYSSEENLVKRLGAVDRLTLRRRTKPGVASNSGGDG